MCMTGVCLHKLRQNQILQDGSSSFEAFALVSWDVATEAHANRRGLCGLMRFAANRARGLFHK